MVAEGVAGVVDQANPCGLAAGLGLSNAGLGPAYILVAGGFRLVCGRLVCAGRVQGMGMGMGVVAFAGHGGFRRAWWLSPGVVAGGRCRRDAVQHGGLCRCACEVDPHHLRPQRRAFCQSSSEPRQWLGARASSIPQQFAAAVSPCRAIGRVPFAVALGGCRGRASGVCIRASPTSKLTVRRAPRAVVLAAADDALFAKPI